MPSLVSEEAIFDLVSRRLRATPASLHADSRFDDLDFDSLDFIQLVMMVEEEFAIKLDDAEAAKVKTVGDLLALARRSPPNGGAT